MQSHLRPTLARRLLEIFMTPMAVVICAATPAAASNPVIVSVSATRQQAVVSFNTSNPAQCTAIVYVDAALTLKTDDTNNALFAGSEACNRAGNIVAGTAVTAVFGARTAQLALDGKRHSRSLSVVTTYWLKITDTITGNTVTTSFTTANIPWGDTHVELPQPDNSAFGGWAYPDLDWTDSGAAKNYVDPLSGVAFTRGPRNRRGEGGNYGDGPTDVHIFDAPIDVHGTWSNVSNAISTTSAGPFASYSGGNRDAIFLPFPYAVDGMDSGVSGQPFRYAFQTADANSNRASVDDVAAVICGSAASSNVEDRKVLACLGVNYMPGVDTCPGPEIEVTLSQGSATCTSIPGSYPAWQFAGWNVGRLLTSEESGIYGGAAATVAGSAVTLGANEFLPVNAAPNWKIHIGSAWYTIASITTAARFTLAESGVNLGTSSWYLGNFGVRIRKKTVTNNAINVSAGFSYVRSFHPNIDPNGQSRDYCSRLTFPVSYQADGVTALSPAVNGRLCVSGSGFQTLFILMDNGETRFVGPVAMQSIQFPMLGAFSTTDAYTFYSVQQDPTDPSGGNSFWRGVYDAGTCKFSNYAGNAYNRTVSVASDCVNWTNMNPYSAGAAGTITSQIDAALAANPIWDNSLAKRFTLGGISGNYAVIGQFAVTQNGPCFAAVFELTNFTLVKFFDSFSGTLPGLRWAGCHSNGIALADGFGNAAFDMSLLRGLNYNGYLSGPFDLPAWTAKSLDGGVTWSADTSLTNLQAGACGGNPYGVTGAQCVKLKVATDLPCSMNAGAAAAGRWPCTWSPDANHSASPLTVQPGDSISRGTGGYDGKAEKFRVLSKTPDGSGWIFEVQRWSVCDNPTGDPNGTPPACLNYDHVLSGQSGNTHVNGWAGYMAAGGETWITLAGDLAHTIWKSDDSPITSAGGHNTVGGAPDGVSAMEIGGGSSRTGPLPAMGSTPAQHSFVTNVTTFNGISTGDDTFELETYPTELPLSAPAVGTQLRRSLYWDWRHVNPSAGNGGGDSLLKIWNHSYTLQAGTSFTYKVSTHGALGTDAATLKSRPPIAWSSRVSFSDISGAGQGNVISDAQPNTYCVAFKANECRTGSSAGDVFVSAPGAYVEFGGCLVNSLKTYSPCVSSLQSYAGWMMEGYTQSNDPTLYRRITMGLAGPGSQYEYTSPHLSADGALALVRPSWLNGIRPDYLVIKMPPPAAVDSVDRTNYVGVPAVFGNGSGFIRIRFGYAENGAGTQFYCTTRKEGCLTDAVLKPFAYAQSETLTAADCRTGCSLELPALSGRMLYYRVERSADGITGWVSGPTQVQAVR